MRTLKFPGLLFLLTVTSSFLLAACSLFEKNPDQTGKTTSKLSVIPGDSQNVKIVENPVMIFHDIVVTPTEKGADLVGKIHFRQHGRYIPGHIDIAVVNNKTREVEVVVSTDFNHRIAEWGLGNLSHPNNMSADLPNIDLENFTSYLAYHPSNIDRKSKFDCGENAALAALKTITEQKISLLNVSQPSVHIY